MSSFDPFSKGGEPARLGRRDFLRVSGTMAALAAGASLLPVAAPEAAAVQAPPANPLSTAAMNRRRQRAYRFRIECAQLARKRPEGRTPVLRNDDETALPGYVASYSKALPHDALGHVDPAAYEALLEAARTQRHEDFEAIPIGGTRKLTSPQAGLAFELEGGDPFAFRQPPAPAFASAECASEMAELYWMALLRDVPFAEYETSPLAAAACDDLSAMSDFRGPKAGGRVTPGTLFRGFTAGDLVGPWVSQFLLHDVPYGSLTVSQRQRTVVPDLNYMTSYDEWLAIQNGGPSGSFTFDPVRRYVRNLRDLAYYVNVDALYEAYLNACLILLGWGAPVDPGLPPVSSRNMEGFAEFGGPHVLSLVTEVATRALKAVWWQKWFVHRRLRPEEFGGRVHNHLTGAASYPIYDDLLGSAALPLVHDVYGTYLLPQAFPEGSPTHPAYGAGHATVAGACVTVLKAFFDESFEIPSPVVPDATGEALVPWTGPPLTVGGELNKVAANIALARNSAGVHWRTDYTESLRLGERVARAILEEQKRGYDQKLTWSFTSFDGGTVRI